MFGRMYPEGWGLVAAVLIFLGFNLTFIPQFLLGNAGMPRRYYTYPAALPGAERGLDRRRLRCSASGFLIILVYLLVVAALRRGGGRQPVGARAASSGTRPRRRRPRTSRCSRSSPAGPHEYDDEAADFPPQPAPEPRHAT